MALNKLTKVQTLGIGSNIEVVGVITTGQFKSGTSNLHASGVELTNLNVSGIATIGGNVSIGGTLTYQDVTNIDSVGLITARAGINVSGGTATFAGDVSIADKIIHTGDTNTAIRFPAADTFAVETAASERLRITSAGRVGINTITPGTNLTVWANDSVTDTDVFQVRSKTGAFNIQVSDSDASNPEWAIRTYSNEPIVFKQATVERLRITSTGAINLTSENTTGWQLDAGDNSASYTVIDNHFPTTNRTLYINNETTHRSIAFWNKNGSDGYGFGLDNSGNFKVVYGSSERVRINSDGDLMVGTTSDVSNVVAIFGKNHNNTTAISVENTDTNSSSRIRYEFKGGSSTSYIEKYNSGGWYFFNGTPTSSNPNVGLYASNSWMSLRLRPGDASNDIAEFYQRWGTSNGILMNIGSAQSGTAKAIRFLTSHYGGERGYIGVTLGGTSYNSSSDYRMKQDVVDLTGAIDRVKSFKPRRFKWKEDPTYTVDGFLAHEASTVVPESVDGEKDAVDSNGDPKYQVMDNSRLVPVLTAALKEAIAKIETLETKVAALEGS